MKLYIMRHGETDWNKERRLQGQADIPLNAFGRQLAAETALGMQEFNFDLVYTSPLGRARETAEIVMNSREIPIIIDERLKEMSFGPYEGKCCSEENWEIPDPEFENFFVAPDRYQPPAGGDSFPDVLARVSAFLTELLAKEDRQNHDILIVCHGVVVNAFLTIIKDRPVAEFWNEKVQKNCAVNIAETTKTGLQLLSEGVTYYASAVKDW